MCTKDMAGENVLLMPLRLISPTIYESLDNKNIGCPYYNTGCPYSDMGNKYGHPRYLWN